LYKTCKKFQWKKHESEKKVWISTMNWSILIGQFLISVFYICKNKMRLTYFHLYYFAKNYYISVQNRLKVSFCTLKWILKRWMCNFIFTVI
jgi:hypothetical protein